MSLLAGFSLLVVALLAAVLSGAVGFGGALMLLPVLTYVVGPKDAIPILTLVQLASNLSRAVFGFREIRWRPIGWFVLGGVPASLLGARLFVALPGGALDRALGVFLLLVVAYRHSRFGKPELREPWLAAAGAIAGFVSALMGSAGPLSAMAFLGLQLPPVAYIASEATAATLMHLSKTAVYGGYAVLTPHDLVIGLAMGGVMVFGTWFGMRLIKDKPGDRFALVVEALIVLSALGLLVR